MQSLWNDTEAAAYMDDLELRAYTSRLLGREPALVLYGGGNTSVKAKLATAFDTQEDILHVKGSGTDLAAAQASDFTPVRLHEVQRLIGLGDLDNRGLARAVGACIAGSGYPKPSIETLLHAVLPFKYVEHTHADSVLAITNTQHGERIAAELFGELAPLVPFHESGFALARACHEVYRTRAKPGTIGLILLHHGVFAFGRSARESYENMLRLVTLAEDYLKARGAWQLAQDQTEETWTAAEIAQLRRAVSDTAGVPLLLRLLPEPECRAFARRRDVAALCAEGPATPQHAVFCKRVPMLGRDVARYATDYRDYVAAHRSGQSLQALGLDPAPRVIVDPGLGVWAAGIDAHYAQVTANVFRHDIEIMSRAAGHDRYAGLPPAAILNAEVHYGGFEQRERAKGSERTSLLGSVFLLAGEPDATAESVAGSMAVRGAAVAMLVAASEGQNPDRNLLRVGGTQPASALRRVVSSFGGLDTLVVRPGFEHWTQVCLELLRLSPVGGRVVAIGPSKWCESVSEQVLRADPALWFVSLELAAEVASPPAAALGNLVAQLCAPPENALHRLRLIIQSA